MLRSNRALWRVVEQRKHEYEVLLFLAVFSTDQTMPMLELRRRTPLSQSRVSRVVSSLEDHGFVRRTIDPDDRRAVTASPPRRPPADQ